MSQNEAAAEERTTAELIETLGGDVDRCFKGMDRSFNRGKKHPDGTIEAKYEFHARQLIRAIFAFIEAVTYSVKLHAGEHIVKNGGRLTAAERQFLLEVEYMLKDNGEINERKAHIRLVDNIRFSFAIQEKSLGIKDKFNANIKWWDCLKSSIKVRDRLMHPKWPEDIDISPDEIITALDAYNGFKKQVMHYADVRNNKDSKPNKKAVRRSRVKRHANK